MTRINPNHRSVMAAALTASFMILAFGLTYRALAARIRAPLAAIPIAQEAIQQFPLQIGDWMGQDVPLDEAIKRKTDADALINRRYFRRNGLEAVYLHIACGVRVNELMQHQPDICYVGSGWTLANHRSVELPFNGDTQLPCGIFYFCRGKLDIERVTVLHYFIADGQHYGSISLLQSRVWRLFNTVDYVAQIQIVGSTGNLSVDSATKLVCAFAVDSAPAIVELFQHIEKDRRSGESHEPFEGK